MIKGLDQIQRKRDGLQCVCGAHCNTGSKGVCWPWRVTFNRKVRPWADRRNLLFSWVYGTQTLRHPPKLTHKRHILGMWASPQNDSHCLKLCHLSSSLITNIPSKVLILAVFGTCKLPAQKFWNFYGCTHAHTDLHLLFQRRSKLVQEKWWKVRTVLVIKDETRFGILRCNTWGDFPRIVCASANHDPSLIFQVSSRSVQIWGRYNRKTPLRPTRVNAI